MLRNQQVCAHTDMKLRARRISIRPVQTIFYHKPIFLCMEFEFELRCHCHIVFCLRWHTVFMNLEHFNPLSNVPSRIAGNERLGKGRDMKRAYNLGFKLHLQPMQR